MTPTTPPRPHLLVVTSTFPASKDDHSPRFVFDLSKRLAAEFEVTVLAPHGPGLAVRERIDGLDVRRFRYLPERFERLAYSGGMPDQLRRNRLNYLAVPFFVLAQTLAMARLLREKPISVIHAHWWIPQAVCALLGRGLSKSKPPIACTLHGADAFIFNRGVMLSLMRFVLSKCDRVFPVSTTVRAVLPENVRERPSTIVAPMGVDMANTFRPVTHADPDYRRAVFVGRLAPKKGVDWLLESFAIAQRDYPDLRLTLVGGGPMMDHCQTLARDLGVSGQVEFTGTLPHRRLPTIYSTAGMAVIPSVEAPGGDREGLGLTAVEALACGCPVIVSDSPSFRDVVENVKNGLAVAQRNRDVLAEAMVRLATDRELQHSLRQHARDSVRHFDWDNIASRYATELKACLQEQIDVRD